MAQTIVMPRFGATMEEGTINSWSVKEGDVVAQGDLLGEISIEKLTNELLAESGGTVLKILAREGETLPCGAPILVIGEAGESSDASITVLQRDSGSKAAPSSLPQTQINIAEKQSTVVVTYVETAQVTPKGLQLAIELGVDYHFIKGTGRFGMITRSDIRQAVQTGSLPSLPAAESHRGYPAVEIRRMTQMEMSVAKAMDASLKSTAQTTISMDLDASALVRAYHAHKEAFNREGVRLTYTAVLIKLVGDALVQHQILRTAIVDGDLVTRPEINIGIAIDLDTGLVVPNIKNADRKSIREIAVELENLVKKAKSNSLTPKEISGGVFTITNLGMFGIKYFTPVLNTGESGILGVGTIQEMPVIQQGGIYVKTIINLSLTHDHRVVNGAPAARFLQSLQQNMDTCETLFISQKS